jgi:putative transposase
MSRSRIQPTQTQESTLLRHCADARYVWNLCVEQESWWRTGRDPMPGFTEDWAEKTSTRLARQFDVIRVENLDITGMTRSARGSLQRPGRNIRAKAGLNRGILGSCWGLLVRRLQDKAPGRVEKVNPAYTSQRCSACGQVDAKSRKSQAVFACTACGYACHADVNAACDLAAGHAVTARGRTGSPERVNREAQLVLLQ